VITPLPRGFGIAVDADTKMLDATTLFGGSPPRILRLTPAGADAWDELRCGPVTSRAGGLLARKLTDAGLVHPRPPSTDKSQLDVTVIIPVRDRAELLDRCLAALGTAHPVMVVDDGSLDGVAIAETAERYGAHLLRRPVSGGPGPARNTGLTGITSEFVAFLDSDCTPCSGWIEELAPHFADPLVAAVAARIVPEAAGGSAARYSAAFSCLDLGAREARVVPGARVAYVPTAALLVRCDALCGIAAGAVVFDPALRHGEDVDLIWRLHEAGWRTRYVPSVRVLHHEPETWPELLDRRFRYGTSAAPLTLRHPTAIRPLVLYSGPTATVVALFAQRPFLAVATFTGHVAFLARKLRRARVPADGLLGASLFGVRQTWLGIGRYACQFAGPALLSAALFSGGRRRWVRWAIIGSLLLSPALTTSRDAKVPTLVRVIGRLADDVAYGAGVWTGCFRYRTLRPLIPALSWRPLRISTETPANHEGHR